MARGVEGDKEDGVGHGARDFLEVDVGWKEVRVGPARHFLVVSR